MATETLQMSFEPGACETTEVIPLGGGLFRLASTPCLAPGELTVGDVVAAHLDVSGTWIVERLVARSGHRIFRWILDRKAAEAPGLRVLKEAVRHHGGTVEQVFGGILLVTIPESVTLDVEAALTEALGPSLGA